MTWWILGLAILGAPLAVVIVVALLRQPLTRLIDRAEEVKCIVGHVKAPRHDGGIDQALINRGHESTPEK